MDTREIEYARTRGKKIIVFRKKYVQKRQSPIDVDESKRRLLEDFEQYVESHYSKCPSIIPRPVPGNSKGPLLFYPSRNNPSITLFPSDGRRWVQVVAPRVRRLIPTGLDVFR